MSYCTANLVVGNGTQKDHFSLIKDFFLNNPVCQFELESETEGIELVLKYKNFKLTLTGQSNNASSYASYIHFKNDTTSEQTITFSTSQSYNYSGAVSNASKEYREINVFLSFKNDILFLIVSPYSYRHPLEALFKKDLSSTQARQWTYLVNEDSIRTYGYNNLSTYYINISNFIKYDVVSLVSSPLEPDSIIFMPKTTYKNINSGGYHVKFLDNVVTLSGSSLGDLYLIDDKTYLAISGRIGIEIGEKVDYTPSQEITV